MLRAFLKSLAKAGRRLRPGPAAPPPALPAAELPYDLGAHEAQGVLHTWVHRSPGRQEPEPGSPAETPRSVEAALLRPATAEQQQRECAGVDFEALLRDRASLRLPDGRALCYTLYGAPLHSAAAGSPPSRVLLWLHGGFSSRLEPALLGPAAEALVSTERAVTPHRRLLTS